MAPFAAAAEAEAEAAAVATAWFFLYNTRSEMSIHAHSILLYTTGEEQSYLFLLFLLFFFNTLSLPSLLFSALFLDRPMRS